MNDSHFRTKHSLPGWVLYVAIFFLLTTTFFAIRASGFQRIAERISSERNDSLGVLKVLETEKRGLLRALYDSDPPGPFLEGTPVMTVASARPSREVRTDGVYYLLEAGCSACAANLPFLTDLEAAHVGSVIGMSLEDPRDSLAAYAANHNVGFPLFSDVRGTLIRRLPRHGVPLTIVIQGGAVRMLVTGLITEAQRESIRRLLERGGPAGS